MNTKEYYEGVKAFINYARGVPDIDNPYPSSSEYAISWDNGWEDAYFDFNND